MKKETGKTIGFVIGGIVIILLMFYLSFSVYFFSHFYFNSTVNGVDSSGDSAGAVAKKLIKEGDSYSLTVYYRDGEEIISPSEINLKVDVTEDMIRDVMKEQNGFLWIKSLFKETDYKSFTLVEYDPVLLSEREEDLAAVKNTNVIMTEDARYEFDGNEYRIIEEVYGTNVNMEALRETLKSAVSTLAPSIDMDKDKCYFQPEITAEDEELNEKVDALNEKLDLNITYTLGDIEDPIEKSEIADWLLIGENDDISYNEEKIREFVSSKAKQYNTAWKEKHLRETGGTYVTIKGGTYGWKIDEEKEYAQLLSDIENGGDVRRDFIYSQTAASHGENDYGNSYIEVNLTTQHMYLYVDGSLVLDSDFVSGNESRGTITHPGAYSVIYKKKDAILRGTNYESHVDYWMPFHNGEGLHDAQWRGSFGGQIYKTNGSHGCVNLPLSVARSLYSYVDAGFPVLVFQMPGYETNAEKTATDNVINLINAIGTVDVNSGNRISAARRAYDNLDEDLRPNVSNYKTLQAAEKEYAALIETLKALNNIPAEPQPTEIPESPLPPGEDTVLPQE